MQMRMKLNERMNETESLIKRIDKSSNIEMQQRGFSEWW
jgi:hypothetical protein